MCQIPQLINHWPFLGLTRFKYFVNLCLYEKDLSALKDKEKEKSWISGKNEVEGWKENTSAQTCEGQEETDTLDGGIAKKTRNNQKKERLSEIICSRKEISE